MSYDYQKERPGLFTDEGQRMLLSVRDRTQRMLAASGAVRLQEMIKGETGDSWRMMACADRLVELGELREVEQVGYVPGQYRLFVSARS